MTRNPRLDAALGYAERGWPVFPCHHPLSGGLCSCGRATCASPAKHPRTEHGLHDATTDPADIKRWWRDHPDANVGIRTGAPSGLVVVDLDLPHGPSHFAQLANGRLDVTAMARTGSGGVHLYFHAPDAAEVRNSTARLGVGIDVRGEGGYVLAPPSRHRSGGAYQWAAGVEVGSLPRWLRQAMEPPTVTPLHRWEPGRGSGRDWARALQDDEVARVAAAPVGTRNNTLNRAAFILGRIAARGALDAGHVRSELEHAALTTGLSLPEVRRTIESGFHAGLERGLHR